MGHRQDRYQPTTGHPIADAHPEDLDAILFPGQDYNNARVYDFEDVDKWENNKREFFFFFLVSFLLVPPPPGTQFVPPLTVQSTAPRALAWAGPM